MNTDKVLDAVVIGAGLTGLTTAYYLNKAGKNGLILEKEERAGGVIHTVSENGFVYETGPNTGTLANVEIIKLLDELNGDCNMETARKASKKRLIWKKGKWNALPSGLFSALGTPLFSWKDKFRIMGEPFRKKGVLPDESVADLVRRRLGRSYLEYAVDPFISGIYAGNPEKLITRFALPKLYALEQNYGSFIRGAIKKKKEPKTDDEKKVTREIFSCRGGMQNLIKALEKASKEFPVRKGVSAVKVNPAKTGGYEVVYGDRSGRVSTLHAKHVVLTVKSPAFPEILPFIEKNMQESLLQLKFAQVIQASVGYNTWYGIPVDAFGGLVPSKEKRNILGILFPSSLFENRAPSGGALLSVFMGGMKNKGITLLTDEEIKEVVLKEISETMQTNIQPDLFKVFRYEYAIPQYEISTEKRLEEIKILEKKYPGLHLAGNCRDGIGMQDRVKQAVQIANQIISGE